MTLCVASAVQFSSLLLLFLVCVVCRSQHQPSRPWLDGIPTALPLISKRRVSRDTDLYTFSLTPPSDDETNDDLTLGIGICSCLLVSPPNNRNITRPYTPVSSRHQPSSFSLLVKRYPDGAMSQEWKRLCRGDPLLFWQIPKNIKEQYPFGKPKTILMLAAGTGITPMYQALQRLFGKDETDSNEMDTNVILIHGCRTGSDAYLKSEMMEMQKRFPNRFSLVHALSTQSHSKRSNRECILGGRRIDEEVIDQVCREHNLERSSCHVWVCGPPSFYTHLCGSPREDPFVSGVLKELGLHRHVVKF